MVSLNSYNILWNWVVSHLQMRKLRLIQVRKLNQSHMPNYKQKRGVTTNGDKLS